MKIIEPCQVRQADHETDEQQSVALLRPPFMVWTLHWLSTLLLLFLLATSLTSGLGFTKRLYPAMWMDWHLSAGIALLVMTAVRMKISHPWKGMTRVFAFGKLDAQAIKSVLLFSVLFVLLSGVMIFQKPPFGRAGYLFGFFPMPTLIRLDHSVHFVIIDLHIALACLIVGLIVAHVFKGLRRATAGDRSRIATMLWPWRKD